MAALVETALLGAVLVESPQALAAPLVESLQALAVLLEAALVETKAEAKAEAEATTGWPGSLARI
ncbi:MAG TPA: hypothetical protein VM686_40220 [Polyangiaceae bacterium]|nr:hypothetical protein [Polyangiaceae bacterium]